MIGCNGTLSQMFCLSPNWMSRFLKGFWHCMLARLTVNNPLVFLKVEMTVMMERVKISLIIASLTRGSKGTFSREAIAWFPFYLVKCIAQCENNDLFRSLSEWGRNNVSKRYFEWLVFPWPWRSEGVIYVATTIANHRPTLKIRFYRTNQMTRFIYHKFTLRTHRVSGSLCKDFVSWSSHYFGRITLDPAMIQVHKL